MPGDRQQWQWSGRARRYHGLAYPALRGANQLLNAAGALAAFEALRERLPVPAQAVRQGLAAVELPGRFQIVPGQPTLVLDVAHNPHAVAALAANLDQMGYFPRTHAVFGAMADKDLSAIVERMAPLVAGVVLHRFAAGTRGQCGAVGLGGACRHTPGPGQRARRSCRSARCRAGRADPADRILIFGSFLTVGGVLRPGLPRLAAKHAA